jgi:hypothetical protein
MKLSIALRPFVWWAAILAAGALADYAGAQVTAPPATPQEENLRVFLDCQRCDFDYFRQEVPFLNYVRDRMDAQLHVLVTQQGTGGGGLEYTFHFIGLGALERRQDTLRYVSLPDETDDETRAGLVRTFKLGLVPFVSSTPLGRRLDVRYQGPRGMPTAEEAADPWNLWVFRARASAEVEGESRSSDRSFDGSFGANRTTEDFKVDLSLRGSYEERKFELSSGEELTSTSHNHELEGTAVWALGPHWSWGVTGSASISTRLNQDRAARLGPAVEYNIYPYAESTRRQITFFYTVEAATFDYEEVTLFDKMSETRVEQTFEASAAFQQPWGEIDASAEWSNFLDDFAQHRLELFARLEIRLFRGLSLDVDGSVARVKNQIYVPREDIPDEDVLLERRQLGTDFEYGFDIGFSYTFGSVFNNAVNPRMSRGGPGGWYH